MLTTIKVEIRPDKIDKRGFAPIRIKYQVKGQRKFIPTGQKVRPVNWDPQNERSIYLNRAQAKQAAPDRPFSEMPLAKEIDQINGVIGETIKTIRNIETTLATAESPITPQKVIDKYNDLRKVKSARDEPKGLVFEYIDKFCQEQRNTVKDNSIKIYRTLQRHLREFSKSSRTPITFSSLDLHFFKSFQSFLLETPVKNKKGEILKDGLTNITAAKNLSTLKTVLNYARRSGIKVNSGYLDFTIKRENLPVIALNNSEFLTLYNADLFNNDRLGRVRDLFCFSCVTGLRYSDLVQLNRNHIKGEYLEFTVFKTKESIEIPLNKYAKQILDKYKNAPTPLPRISNQKLNSYLKELAKDLGLDNNIEIVRFKGAERTVTVKPLYELIGAHTGRRTFVTLSLERGMTAEQVMSITGHKDYKSFKRYVNVTKEVKRHSLVKAWDNPEMKIIKNVS